MTRPYAVGFSDRAMREVQRERVWLHNNRGPARADAFEAELRHTLELLADNPEMGAASPEREDERRIFLLTSRFHVFYVVNHRREQIRVVRLRHERQRPL